MVLLKFNKQNTKSLEKGSQWFKNKIFEDRTLVTWPWATFHYELSGMSWGFPVTANRLQWEEPVHQQVQDTCIL